MHRWIVAVACAIAITGMVGHAHHSIAALYDTSRQVTIEGVVTAFRFVNPHPYLTMEVKNAGGSVQQWRLEIDNRSELVAIGVTRETWKSGDWIIVTGSPARHERQSLYVRRLDRPADSLRYEQVGSSPRIHAPSRQK